MEAVKMNILHRSILAIFLCTTSATYTLYISQVPVQQRAIQTYIEPRIIQVGDNIIQLCIHGKKQLPFVAGVVGIPLALASLYATLRFNYDVSKLVGWGTSHLVRLGSYYPLLLLNYMRLVPADQRSALAKKYSDWLARHSKWLSTWTTFAGLSFIEACYAKCAFDEIKDLAQNTKEVGKLATEHVVNAPHLRRHLAQLYTHIQDRLTPAADATSTMLALTPIS